MYMIYPSCIYHTYVYLVHNEYTYFHGIICYPGKSVCVAIFPCLLLRMYLEKEFLISGLSFTEDVIEKRIVDEWIL